MGTPFHSGYRQIGVQYQRRFAARIVDDKLAGRLARRLNEEAGMKLLRTIGVALCGALVLASVAAAQGPTRRAPGTPTDNKVGVTIALQAGAESYQFNGQATCTREPKGYIYGVPAQQWRVEQSEGARSVGLTFWRPASGSGDMFMLHLSSAGKTYATDTVKTKAGGALQGSGEVTFTPAGTGGTFTVNATAANGIKVNGTIKCDAFTAAIAEGGN